jgi:hypothetical protein
MVRVPVLVDFADHTEIVALGGVTYRLRFRWNGRSESWFLDVLGAGGEVLVAGVRVRLEWPLLRQHVNAALPEGETIALDATGTRAEPGRDDLGQDARPVVFVPDDEVARAATGTLLP